MIDPAEQTSESLIPHTKVYRPSDRLIEYAGKSTWFSAIVSSKIGSLMEQYPRQYLYLRAVRAKLYIDANFASSIDLDKIADEACFSKFHFVRLFKSIYGRTPHQYLTLVRVEKAKEYLAGGQTVAYACFKVGFDSISSFTGLFKRRTGQTPRQFQLERFKFRESVSAVPLNHIPVCFAEKAGWNKNRNFREVKSIDPAISATE
jgi:AraC-like DNA-binding protein